MSYVYVIANDRIIERYRTDSPKVLEAEIKAERPSVIVVTSMTKSDAVTVTDLAAHLTKEFSAAMADKAVTEFVLILTASISNAFPDDFVFKKSDVIKLIIDADGLRKKLSNNK